MRDALLDEIGRGKVLSTSTGLPRNPERAMERLRSLAEVGVDQVVLKCTEGPRDLIIRIQMYGDEVFSEGRILPIEN